MYRNILPTVAAFALLITAHAAEPIDLMPVNESDLDLQGATVAFAEENGQTVMNITFIPHPNYRNVIIKGPGGSWDLSGCVAVVAEVRNETEKAQRVGVRVDENAEKSQQPWNQNGLVVPPGSTESIRVTFGESFGRPAYKLNPSNIESVRVYIGKGENEEKFTLLSIKGVPGD